MADLLMINLIFFLANYIAHLFGAGDWKDWNLNQIVICNLIWLVCAAYFHLYSVIGNRKIERVYRSTYKSVICHGILFVSYLMFHKNIHVSLTFIAIFYSLLGISFIINRFLGTIFHYILIERFKTINNVAIIGSNQTSLKLVDYLKDQKNISFYGILGSDGYVNFGNEGIISEEWRKRLLEAAQAGVKDIFITIALDRLAEVHVLLNEADKHGIRIKFVPDLGLSLAPNYSISYLGNEFPVITLRNEPLEEIANRFKKRAFDIIFSSLVIIFILSWLFPILAILIKLESRGPVFFKQQRSGRKDIPFWCYKFRSMKVNRESNLLQATKEDVRITKIGRFLRTTSLDEMPQFVNVLIGNMSVVGPRPHMLAHTKKYKMIIDKYMVRHFVKPGITGWAQVHGFRGETRNLEDMENRIKYDIYYLENWTAMFDVRIVFMTIINIFKGDDNAY